MADYAIGDVQGCYEPLLRLLDFIHFNEHSDRLWFVGDLVNRGPQSLEVLRFIKSLPIKPHITLGNHDLHLLVKIFTKNPKYNADDTLHPILIAEDAEAIGHWLRHQSILVHDEALNLVMSHAGIAPVWSIDTAKQCAKELEAALQADTFHHFLDAMYGNQPDYWDESLSGMDRLRVITNYFTRMRFCDLQGRLVLDYKGTIANAPADLVPWFGVPERIPIPCDIVFGHWAALLGQCALSGIHAIDTGSLWGGQLTALRLQDRKRFAVTGMHTSHNFFD